MKFYQIVLLLTFTNISFAASNFNYAAFSGTYQLEYHDPHGVCELNFSRPIELTNSPEAYFVLGTFNNGSYIKMNNINQGKKVFDSCWSDGTLGYTDTTGSDTLVQEKTVYLKPGLFCHGGAQRYNVVTSWEVKGNFLIMKSRRSDSDEKLICQFKRISSDSN